MKLLFSVVLFLLASLLSPIQAQTSAKPPNVDGAKDPLMLLAEVRKNLSALKAEFTQYELSQDNEKLDVNTGTVWMESPDHFRWEYKDPIEQLIVADGTQVWVYDEDLEQVTVKQQDNKLNPIYVIINDELSQQHYVIKYVTTDKQIDWVSLTPRVQSDEVKFVWLAIENSSITSIKVFNYFDQVMVFEFHQIEKNPELVNGLFEFTPAEGIDVIQALGE